MSDRARGPFAVLTAVGPYGLAGATVLAYLDRRAATTYRRCRVPFELAALTP